MNPSTKPVADTLKISFEFFPPASDSAAETLARCARELEPFTPEFVSVTYGAGGTTRDRTHAAVDRLNSETSMSVAGHLTCVGATKPEVGEVIDNYLAVGVRHIVALRGDPPEGGEGLVDGGYLDAVDLVGGIRDHVDKTQVNKSAASDLEISVAAYPEVHPKAHSAQSDLDNLKAKLDAGADRALTQFFFDTDVFLSFLDRARAAGITAPIVPGIMPINSFAGIRRFASRCGTNIPGWMSQMFEGLDDHPETARMVAASVAAEQCRRLIEAGVDEFHFYTMNKPELTAATCRAIGIHPTAALVAEPAPATGATPVTGARPATPLSPAAPEQSDKAQKVAS